MQNTNTNTTQLNQTTTVHNHGKKINVKKAMFTVWLTLIPIAFFAMYNTGHQALIALSSMDTTIQRLGSLSISYFGSNPESSLACFAFGAIKFLPIYAVSYFFGFICDFLLSKITKSRLNRGFIVTALIFCLTLPATIPLWEVAIGISFGVLITHLITNSRNHNMFNPALIGRAFICLLYPESLSGTAVWTAVDGFTGATALGLTAINVSTQYYIDAFGSPISWSMLFFGNVQGSMGETSTLLILILSVILVRTKVASWRVIAGGFAGLIIVSSTLNVLGHSGVINNTAVVSMPFYWHAVVGGFAFGLIFMATDPLSAPKTQKGRWLFGFIIGSLTILIRAFHPSYVEGIMWAIIIANMCVSMIDYTFGESGSKTNHMNKIDFTNILDRTNVKPITSLLSLILLFGGFGYLMLP